MSWDNRQGPWGKEQRPPEIDETPRKGELPRPYCCRIARAKAEAVDAGADDIVLCVDDQTTAHIQEAHGVIIHGPCTIGRECFLALGASLYKVTLEDHVWLGIGAIAKLVTLHSFTRVPAGAVIRDRPEVMALRLITDKERKYMEEVWAANSRLRMDYLELRNKAESIKATTAEKIAKKMG